MRGRATQGRVWTNDSVLLQSWARFDFFARSPAALPVASFKFMTAAQFLHTQLEMASNNSSYSNIHNALHQDRFQFKNRMTG